MEINNDWSFHLDLETGKIALFQDNRDRPTLRYLATFNPKYRFETELGQIRHYTNYPHSTSPCWKVWVYKGDKLHKCFNVIIPDEILLNQVINTLKDD